MVFSLLFLFFISSWGLEIHGQEGFIEFEVMENFKYQPNPEEIIEKQKPVPVATIEEPKPTVVEVKEPELEVAKVVEETQPVIQGIDGLPLDILLVIDTSFSMYVITENVEEKWTGFLHPLINSDFRLAIIDSNTSPDGVKTLLSIHHDDGETDDRNYIHKGLKDPEQSLVHSLNTLICENFPFCGSGTERALGSLENYFQSQNGEFIREEVDKLFVLILTDNKESNKRGQRFPTTSQDVINSFQETFPNKELIVISFTVSDQVCRRQLRTGFLLSVFGEGNVSEQSMDLSQRTNGEIFSLCLDSYEPVAQQVINSVLDNQL